MVAKTFPLADGAEALRYLIEGRPFGRSSSQFNTTSRARLRCEKGNTMGKLPGKVAVITGGKIAVSQNACGL